MVGRTFVHCTSSSSSSSSSSYTVRLLLLCILTHVGLVGFVSSREHQFGDTSRLCWKSLQTHQVICRPVCRNGYFALPGMDQCHHWLGCEHIDTEIDIGELLGQGAIKMVFEAFWNNFTIALNIARKEYHDDFQHGKEMLIAMQPNPHVVQLVGSCGNRYLTEYHPMKSADNFLGYITSPKYRPYDSLELRFQLCLDYVHIVSLMHNSPMGTRVLCDSNDLKKTLSQFLLRSDFRLIFNDMDALPEVNHTTNRLIKCGPREIGGDFVAPEQLWPYPSKPFTDEEMPPYDEKTDIWKIPPICNHFLDSRPDAVSLRLHLFYIHSRCQEENPRSRPDAKTVMSEYKQAWTLYRNDHKRKTEL